MAEPDRYYGMILQQRLIETFEDRIELEIITEEDYLGTLLKRPQQADVLLIDETLYSDALIRHEIRSILILCDSSKLMDQSVIAGAGSLRYIYKYTSLSEIMDLVLEACRDRLPEPTRGRKQAKIVLLCSADDGPYQEALGVGLAAALSRWRLRVLLLSAAYLQTFQMYLKDAAPLAGADVTDLNYQPMDELYASIKPLFRKEGFTYLPPFPGPLMALNLSIGLFERIGLAAKASGDFDLILIEARIPLNECLTQLMDLSDLVLVLKENTKRSFYITQLFLDALRKGGGGKFRTIALGREETEDVLPMEKVDDTVALPSRYEEMSAEALGRVRDIARLAALVKADG